MSILLSHTTALEALRGRSLRERLARGERCRGAVPDSAPTREELASAHAPLKDLSRPLEVLVSTRGARMRTGEVVTHVMGAPLPEGSALWLAPGVQCVSPEQLLVQMACQLTLLELVFLAYELLGIYALDPSSSEGMRQRSVPTTTPERVLEHLGRLGSARGTRVVRRALGLACAGSGSPRETKLAMRLSLPPSMGGYNLKVLSMNAPVEVERVHDPSRSGTRRPDILLGGRDGRVVALEYNGRHHDEPWRAARDAARGNELKAAGVTEYVIRREQYRDLEYMDGLVAVMRRELGLKRVGLSAVEARRRRELRQALYEELERMDGLRWDGRTRARASGEGSPVESVPVSAYGLA